MKNFKLFLLAFCALFVGGLRDNFATVNTEGPGKTHHGVVTRIPDSTNFSNFTAQHLLLMAGSDVDHVQVCDGAHLPLGHTDDDPQAAGDPIQMNLLGSIKRTVKMLAASALAASIDVYASTANPGFIIALPAVAGAYYKVGTSVYTGVQNADGNYEVEVDPCQPEKVLVIAAATGTAATDIAALFAALATGPGPVRIFAL
jgi:hypothetical protein